MNGKFTTFLFYQWGGALRPHVFETILWWHILILVSISKRKSYVCYFFTKDHIFKVRMVKSHLYILPNFFMPVLLLDIKVSIATDYFSGVYLYVVCFKNHLFLRICRNLYIFHCIYWFKKNLIAFIKDM